MSVSTPASTSATGSLSQAEEIRQRKLKVEEDMRYYEPEVLKTAHASDNVMDNEASIDGLLMDHVLRGAIVCSNKPGEDFLDWSMWLEMELTKTHDKSDPEKIGSKSLQLFLHAKSEEEKNAYMEKFGTGSMNHRGDASNFCLHFPAFFGPEDVMNAKMMLLQFDNYDFLRLVIMTGDLVDADWGHDVLLGDSYRSVKENMVFVADLPRLFPGDKDTNGDNQFFESLWDFTHTHLRLGRNQPSTDIKNSTVVNG